MTTPNTPYTLSQAEEDIAALRNQLAILQEYAFFDNVSVTPPSNPNGISNFSQGDYARYLSADGNNYAVGSVFTSVTSTITVNQTTLMNLLTIPILAGELYQIEAELVFLANQSAGQPKFFIGVSNTGTVIGSGQMYQGTAGGLVANVYWNGPSSLSTPLLGPVMTNNVQSAVKISGIISVTAAGNLSISADTTNAADTFQIAVGSYFKVTPT